MKLKMYINKYSLILVLVYLSMVVLMEHYSNAVAWEGFYITAPLICAVVFWSGKVKELVNENNYLLTKEQQFRCDLFLINFGFLFAMLLSCLIEYKNSDLLGSWPLALYFFTIYGFIFAFIFSLSALLLRQHKNYTFGFVFLIILLVLALNFFAYTRPFSIFGKTEAFYVITGIVMCVHLLLCLGYKMIFIPH